FDTFSNIKFVITGSSSFDLTSLGASLVGRIIFFTMYPLSFAEFISTKGEQYFNLYKKIHVELNTEIKIEETVFLEDLNKFLKEFLTFGSYPAVVLEQDREKKKELLKNLFTTYIEKDIVALYGIRQREHVVKLLKTIASVTGQVINYETLSVHSGLSYGEVREFLPLLEDSFVISLVRPLHKNLASELRKNPKIYFIDPGIRNYLFEQFENINFDFLYETFLHNQLIRSHKVKYWRTTNKTEVDFIVEKKDKLIPIEVKITPKLTRSFRSFLSHYKPEKAFIANLNEVEKINIENCEVFILPFVYF
ncbi:DUF4143 domain-containing protein, partial [Candidatus Woesearchaeota archaeon]|nr:DUF4143 domain-containing protein [Candidatus Woesearchaeota archaeon]